MARFELRPLILGHLALQVAQLVVSWRRSNSIMRKLRPIGQCVAARPS
jgi:hypothetical protein